MFSAGRLLVAVLGGIQAVQQRGRPTDDVIMCRAKSGDVRVLLNSCAHRGTQLCRSDSGDQLVLNPLRE
jgi:nitrite reductase/ring-hydroxylating ferredoxin subunit